MDSLLSMARRDLALRIIGELRSQGHKAYLVGGCVRDRLLGITPKDYDVSTDATPQIVLSYFAHGQKVGAHFGVILVATDPDIQVEVATVRTRFILRPILGSTYCEEISPSTG